MNSADHDRNGPRAVPVPAPAHRREIARYYSGPPGFLTGESEGEQEQSGKLFQDLLGYFWILYRHRWVVLGVAAVFIGIGLLLTLLTTPIYRASATMQIEREAAKVVELDVAQGNAGNDAAFFATQYELLKSRSLAERVVADFTVQELQDFTGVRAEPPLAKVRGLFLGTSEANAPAAVDSAEVAALQKQAAYKILGGLAVQPVGTSRVVRLSYESADPRWAQRVVNAVTDKFVEVTLNRRFDASSYARDFLEDKLKELKVKLEDSERALVGYAQKEQIINVDERRSLVTDNLAALNQQLQEVGTERLKYEQLLEQARRTDGLALPQIVQNEAVQAMRERRAELAAEYQNKLSVFKPAFPDMQMLQAQISEIDRQIAAEVELTKDTIEASYDSALAQERMINAQLDALKVDVLDLEGRGIRYRILQREVDTNRELYDGLLQRFKEVGVAGAVGTNNVSIVDPAEIPGGPIKPSLPMNLGMALAFGFLCGGLAAFGLEYLDDTYKVPEEMETALGLPVLGIVPVSETPEAHHEALADPRSALSEAYRSLRTALQFSTSDGVPKTILVTSSRPGEGKSTTSLSLAKNFAQLGLKVLLIDADLRNPSLHEALRLEVGSGLSNFLTSSSLPPRLLQKTEQDTLTFMASGPLPPNPAELLAGPRMASLLAFTSQKFDVTIIDGPPVMGLADAPLLASISGGTLLVVEAGVTRKGIVRDALKRLHFARAQMIGTLLNKFDASKAGHTYGYGYGYGYGDYYGYGSTNTPKLTQTTDA